MLKTYELQKSNRLNKARHYRRVFRCARRFSDASLQVIVAKNQLAVARLGFSVPKKYVARAVDRNKIKRIFREEFRHNKSILKGLDIVVIVRAKQHANSQNIATLLSAHWDRISHAKNTDFFH